MMDNLVCWMELIMGGLEQVKMYLDNECHYLFMMIANFPNSGSMSNRKISAVETINFYNEAG